MSRCVRQSNRSVRKRGEQLQCTCPEDRQTQSDELTKSIACRTDLGANTASADEEEEVLEQSDDSIPVVQVNCAFLHNIGHKGAKVTFLTMVDNGLGSMVATAVQKKGHDKFVERFL